jgi:hypothetical protein
VHARDHRGRAALAREPLDDVRGGRQTEALAADLRPADETEQTGIAERAHGLRGKRAAIDVGGVARRGGGDGFDRLLVLERHVLLQARRLSAPRSAVTRRGRWTRTRRVAVGLNDGTSGEPYLNP